MEWAITILAILNIYEVPRPDIFDPIFNASVHLGALPGGNAGCGTFFGGMCGHLFCGRHPLR